MTNMKTDPCYENKLYFGLFDTDQNSFPKLMRYKGNERHFYIECESPIDSLIYLTRVFSVPVHKIDISYRDAHYIQHPDCVVEFVLNFDR